MQLQQKRSLKKRMSIANLRMKEEYGAFWIWKEKEEKSKSRQCG